MKNEQHNILIVDDNLKNIQVGVNFLKQTGNYHLVFATSGQQALERVKDMEFDLILLDIVMPGMDGYEVCKHLKEDEATRQIPVVFLTAKCETDQLVKGFEVGGADYITKPFNAHELRARVQTHLELNSYYKNEIKRLKELLSVSEKSEMVKLITAGVIHDCNNFIGSIPSNIYFVKSYLKENSIKIDQEHEQMLDAVSTAVKNVSELLSSLSEHTNNESYLPQMIDMNLVVKDIKHIFKGTIDPNIEFEINTLDHSAFVYADKLHLEQVLLNLLINAQQAILEGENKRNGKISLNFDKINGSESKNLKDEETYLRIGVEDNGKGMTPEIRKQVFDKFYTTRKDIGGTGLGLALSLKIIKSYEGAIDLFSEEGEGTVFHVYLPYCEASF